MKDNRWMMLALVVVAAAWAVVLVGCGEESEADGGDCIQGTHECGCEADGTCREGLECVDGTCSEPFVGEEDDHDGDDEQSSCPEADEASACAPTTNPQPADVGQDEVTLEGELEAVNPPEVVDHGFCVGTQPEPTECSSLGVAGEAGTFSMTIDGLESVTDYYARSFATFGQDSGEETVYGEDMLFSTNVDFVDETVIAAGLDTTCRVDADQSLWCWGDGNSGELGLGDEEDRLVPGRVGDDFNWRSVSTGAHHTCGIRDDGRLWCWGQGSSGRLGHGDLISHDEPEEVGDETWQSVFGGLSHTCGVQTDGTLWCWGANSNGKLGIGDTDGRHTPTRVGDEDNWRAVVVGERSSLGVREDGTLWAWGGNTSGRLGVGDSDDRQVPAQVGDDQAWSDVSNSMTHACGIHDGGRLSCWGSGREGRLGQGDDEDRYEPAQVGDDADWTEIAVGGFHTCGVRDDGSIWCWGEGQHGQVGDGEGERHKTPQQVGDDTDWVDVAAGVTHSCGVRDDASVWCWGGSIVQNFDADPLGLGESDTKMEPTRVDAF